MADYEMYEREVGFRLRLACTERAPEGRFETPMLLVDREATATVTVISSRGKRLIVDRDAVISEGLAHVFECPLTADDLTLLSRGDYRVWWRGIVDDEAHVFERSLLVKPSPYTSTSLGEVGMFFDDEDNSELAALL